MISVKPLPISNKKDYTYSDYAELPEGAPYQLIGGRLIMVPAPVPKHQAISRRIGFSLLKITEEFELGEVFYAPIDVYFSEADTFQPDIIFIAKHRRHIIGDKKIEGAPDLVVEILSPTTAAYDRNQKKAIYERHGVKEYWIVDPEEKRVELYVNRSDHFHLEKEATAKGEFRSVLIPDFIILPEKVFQPIGD